ncbi:EIN3-binding F-box protein 1-like isoform X2 [Acanthaster planci]|uniref:EIN3-binding F-box protein 1-like isoform X2 n=1 Tax=Acanthaster planci TaxID=133434 RepID=A0A8B7ZYG8_ACAPL|nr:EIN3-binding F-box protein 1-like isoform X2 [Acanthaster planci]
MPRRKSAGSLQDVCLRFIAKNLLYWTEHYEEYYLGQGVYRFVLGPFNQLNSQLSEDLLTFLVKQQQLSRSALHLLLYGGALQNLDLSSCSRIVNDEVVRIVTSSCKCEDFMSVCNGMLQAIPDLCPHVTQLDLRFAGGFDNEGLFHLAQLHNLKDLQLCCEESENITFRCGIMPVLLEIGHNLKVLSLQDIGGLDPAMVCQLCPNLRKLFLLMMKEGKVFSSLGGIPNNSKLQPMTGLIELDFWCQNGDISLSEEALGLLLTNCIALESLGLIRIDTLTDNVLRSVLRKNSFSNLKQLSVHECHCITQETLSELLSATSNQLEFVKLINCLQITRKDYETWEKTAKRENFNIKLEWK